MTPEIGSTWYAWGRHVRVVEHTLVNGEPAIREQDIRTGKKLPSVPVRLFLRKAQATDPKLYEEKS